MLRSFLLEISKKLAFLVISFKVFIDILLNFHTSIIVIDKAKGFGFVDFEEPDDALAAIANMDGAELLGRVLSCKLARPTTKYAEGKPIWLSEEYIENKLGMEAVEENQ